jgi:hypothetical protein
MNKINLLLGSIKVFIKKIVDKLKNYLNPKNKTEDEKSLLRLNVCFYILLFFIGIYLSVMLYTIDVNTEKIQNNQETIRSLVMLPDIKQIGGFITDTNTSNISLVTTNITKEQTKILVADNKYTVQKEYNRGDMVMVRYFNIYGVVRGKSVFSSDYYDVLYRDNGHTLRMIELPYNFLLKPSPGSLSPFTFTP